MTIKTIQIKTQNTFYQLSFQFIGAVSLPAVQLGTPYRTVYCTVHYSTLYITVHCTVQYIVLFSIAGSYADTM